MTKSSVIKGGCQRFQYLLRPRFLYKYGFQDFVSSKFVKTRPWRILYCSQRLLYKLKWSKTFVLTKVVKVSVLTKFLNSSVLTEVVNEFCVAQVITDLLRLLRFLSNTSCQRLLYWLRLSKTSLLTKVVKDYSINWLQYKLILSKTSVLTKVVKGICIN